MMRKALFGLLATIAVIGDVAAQTRPPDGKLVRDPYVTSTGATVDRPGLPQASGPTPLDRKIQRQDNKIDTGICKGC